MSERQTQVPPEGSPEEIVLTPYTSTNITAIALIEAAVFTQAVHVEVGPNTAIQKISSIGILSSNAQGIWKCIRWRRQDLFLSLNVQKIKVEGTEYC